MVTITGQVKRKLHRSRVASIVVFILLVCTRHSYASAHDELYRKIEHIALQAHGTVGVALEVLETGDTLSFNGSYHSPMQSSYKFPLALCILNQVDQGRISLDSVMHLEPKDLDNVTWSPIVDEHPNRHVDLTIRELLRYMVSGSDNNACDILFTVCGGTSVCNTYIHSLGIKNIEIVKTEGQMHADWNAQFDNWCEPVAMRSLLHAFYETPLLSPASHELLLKYMTESTTGAKRIKGKLPKDAVVAHKSGTSGFSTTHKVTAATNDIGIVTLRNGKHLAIAIFVSMAKGRDSALESVIAQIAKAAWDQYSN